MSLQESNELTISEKQALFFEIANNPQIVDLLFGGGAGGGKSLAVTLWLAIECRKYPGIRIGLGRKELVRLKQTTVHTLIHETHKLLGISEHEYTYNEQKNSISYVNGSSVLLVDLARMPSDPEFDRLGSLNLTHTIIEEGGEVDKKARDIFISRKNRYLNNEYNLVGKSITTCNPSENYLKSLYYKPYTKQGGGEYQIWKHGFVYEKGIKKQAYRAFVRSLATDNPFISPNYISVLKELPDAERKRLLEGNWNFAQNDYMLFNSLLLERVTVDNFTTSDKKFVGVDISDSGDDNTFISLIENDVLTEQEEIEVDKTKPIGEQIALAIIKFAQTRGITDPKNIGIDVIGVGASTRDFLRAKGWFVSEFVAGASPEKPIRRVNKYKKQVETGFKNLRGQTVYKLSEAMGKDEIKIYSKLATIEDLKEDLRAHEYTTEERQILVKSKKDIKEKLGHSPDKAESFYIAYWVSKKLADPRNNSSRIVV